MLYQLTYDVKYHPEAILIPTNHDSIGKIYSNIDSKIDYEGDFIVDGFDMKTLATTDIVNCLSSISIVSYKLMKFISDYYPNKVIFKKCNILQNGQNVLDYIGDKVSGFYIMKVVNCKDLIDFSKKPIDFWPLLKRFKFEDFVMKGCDEDFSMAIDIQEPSWVIVTETFREACEAAKLHVGFSPLPCPWVPSNYEYLREKKKKQTYANEVW